MALYEKLENPKSYLHPDRSILVFCGKPYTYQNISLKTTDVNLGGIREFFFNKNECYMNVTKMY